MASTNSSLLVLWSAGCWTLLCPPFFTHIHISPHINITHPLIQTQGNTPLFQQPSALCHAPYEHAWQHFAHAVIANYSNPCRHGQSQGDVPERESPRLVFDQEQAIQEEAWRKRQQQVQQQRTGASRQLKSDVHSTYPTQRITGTAPDPNSKTNKAAAITTTNLSSICILVTVAHHVTAPLRPVMWTG